MSDSDVTATSTAFSALITETLPAELHQHVPAICTVFDAADAAEKGEDGTSRYYISSNDTYFAIEDAMKALFGTEGLPAKMAAARGLDAGLTYAYIDDGWVNIEKMTTDDGGGASTDSAATAAAEA